MNWSSGTELAEKLWDTVREHIPEAERREIAEKWVREFDWLYGTQLGLDAGVIHDDDLGSHWPWEHDELVRKYRRK